jgi:hypothetical protein
MYSVAGGNENRFWRLSRIRSRMLREQLLVVAIAQRHYESATNSDGRRRAHYRLGIGQELIDDDRRVDMHQGTHAAARVCGRRPRRYSGKVMVNGRVR